MTASNLFSWISMSIKKVLEQRWFTLFFGVLVLGCVSITPPVASNDFNTTFAGKSVELDLLHNDYGHDTNPLEIKVVKAPEHGKLEMLPKGIVKYTPNTDHLGVDQFEYIAVSRSGKSTPAKVTIMVTPAVTESASPRGDDAPNIAPSAASDAIPDKPQNRLAVEAIQQPSEPAVTRTDTVMPSVAAKAATAGKHPEPVMAKKAALADAPAVKPVAAKPAQITVVTADNTNDPGKLIKDAYECLTNNNKACAIQHCDMIPNTHRNSEMTSLCGTLFDPSMGVKQTHADPLLAYKYYKKANSHAASATDNLNRLLDWLTTNKRFPELREEIRKQLG